jgi:hypothetical protein
VATKGNELYRFSQGKFLARDQVLLPAPFHAVISANRVVKLRLCPAKLLVPVPP